MFYYYGAKTKTASKYPKPRYRIVVEPFAGSAGYSVYHLRRGNIDGAILIEKDPRVVELWQRLLAMSPAEVLALTPPPIDEWTDDYLWMAPATSSALNRVVGYRFSKRAAAVSQSMLNRIAKVLPHVQGKIIVMQGDYRTAPDIEATWFIDPPYQTRNDDLPLARGNGYAMGCDALAMDYSKLGEWCRTRRGQTMVCEVTGAEWLPFRDLHPGWSAIGHRPHYETIWTHNSIRRISRRHLNGKEVPALAPPSLRYRSMHRP